LTALSTISPISALLKSLTAAICNRKFFRWFWNEIRIIYIWGPPNNSLYLFFNMTRRQRMSRMAAFCGHFSTTQLITLNKISLESLDQCQLITLNKISLESLDQCHQSQSKSFT
jgi:hypothetical protein